MNRFEAFPELSESGERHREHRTFRLVVILLTAAVFLVGAAGAAAFFVPKMMGKPDLGAVLFGASRVRPQAAASGGINTTIDSTIRAKLAAATAQTAAAPMSMAEAAKMLEKAEKAASEAKPATQIAALPAAAPRPAAAAPVPAPAPAKNRPSDGLPSLNVAAKLSGKPGQTMPFSLSVNADGVLPDDSKILIHGLPEGTVLSAGHADGTGGWLLSPDDLDGLTLTPGMEVDGTSDLTIALQGPDGRLAGEVHAALKVSGVPVAATPDEIRAWMSHGRDLERVGYFAGARLFFKRAADAGSAEAAHAMGETYDPAEFEKLGVHGLTPDPAQAQKWYERAKVLETQAAKHQAGNAQ